MEPKLLVIDDSATIQCHLDSLGYVYIESSPSLREGEFDTFVVNGVRVALLGSSSLTTDELLKVVHSNSGISLVVFVGDHHSIDLIQQDTATIYTCRYDELGDSLLQQFLVIADQTRVIDQLKHESYCYRKMVDSCPDYVFIRDKEHRIVFANAALANLHEMTPLDMIGKTYTELTGDVDGGAQVAEEDSEILDTGVLFYKHDDFYHDQSGSIQWNRVSKKRIANADGSGHLVLGVATHLTEWKEKETQLEESETRYKELYTRQQVLGQISDTISRTSNIESMLHQVAALLPKLFNTQRAGIRYHQSDIHINVIVSDELLTLESALHRMPGGSRKHAVFEGVDKSSIAAASIQSEDVQEHILYAIRPVGVEPFTEQDAEQLGGIANQCLVTIAKTVLYEKIQHQAYHDSLTGLPNRLHFEKVLVSKLSRQGLDAKPFSVLFLDLNGFKLINDSYGHLVGDSVLQEVSLRFLNIVAGNGLLARMGGDEFSFLMDNCGNKIEAENFSKRILNQLQEEVSIDAQRFSIGASIGVAVYPDDDNELTGLMRKADSAMYHAKTTGTTHIAFYNSDIEAKEQRRLRLEKDLAFALVSDGLELHYQPQFELKSRCISGVEALARWQHPELGYIPPEEFVSVAEQSHLILELGNWVIATAFKQAKCWQDAGYKFKTAVNLSPKQCEQVSFSSDLLTELYRHELDSSSIEVEVTESTLMNDMELISGHLQVLRSKGISVAIDDFGTGYSSLGYLQHLPLDILKIDRSFVASMNLVKPETSLIAVIVRMAEGLGLATVVEGVETDAQVSAATLLGCDFGQGWYFEKALPAAEIEPLLVQFALKTIGGSERVA